MKHDGERNYPFKWILRRKHLSSRVRDLTVRPQVGLSASCPVTVHVRLYLKKMSPHMQCGWTMAGTRDRHPMCCTLDMDALVTSYNTLWDCLIGPKESCKWMQNVTYAGWEAFSSAAVCWHHEVCARVAIWPNTNTLFDQLFRPNRIFVLPYQKPTLDFPISVNWKFYPLFSLLFGHSLKDEFWAPIWGLWKG